MASRPQLIPVGNLPIKEFVLEKICNGILAPFIPPARLGTAFVQKIGNRLVRVAARGIQLIRGPDQLRFLLHNDNLIFLLVLEVSKGDRSILNPMASHFHLTLHHFGRQVFKIPLGKERHHAEDQPSLGSCEIEILRDRCNHDFKGIQITKIP